MAFLKLSSESVEWGVLAAMSYWGSAWAKWAAAQPDAWLPAKVNQAVSLLFLCLGAGLTVGLSFVPGREHSGVRRGFGISWLGFFLWLMMIAVIVKEPGNFYAVSAGVFASLIIALAAGWHPSASGTQE